MHMRRIFDALLMHFRMMGSQLWRRQRDSVGGQTREMGLIMVIGLAVLLQ